MEYKLITERSHLCAPNIHICFMVEFCQVFDTGSLGEAIKKVMQKHPILRSSVRFDDKGNAYYHIEDEVEPVFYVKTMIDDQSWIAVVAREQEEPFVLNRAPLIRFACLKNESRLQLIMCVHHLFADGLSCVKILQDILSFVENPQQTVTEGQSALLEDSILYSNERLSLPVRILVAMLNREWRKAPHIFSEAEYVEMRKNYWRQRSHTIATAELDASQTGKLISKSKDNRVTVNSLLMTALLESAQKIRGTGKKHQKVGIAVNIRSSETNIGNFASGISVEYGYKTTKSIWENACAIQSLVQRKLNCDQTKYFLLTFLKALDVNLIDSIYFSLFGDFRHKATDRLRKILGYLKKPTGIAITNLGKNQLSVEHGIKTAFFIPPLTANTDKIAGVVTTDSGMKLSYQYSNQENSEANREIFEDWVCRLGKLK